MRGMSKVSMKDRFLIISFLLNRSTSWLLIESLDLFSAETVVEEVDLASEFSLSIKLNITKERRENTALIH